MKNTQVKQSGPGRPRYSPKFPAKLRWTMLDFQLRNGVNPTTGKGDNCSKLTLVKFLADQLRNTRSGLIVKLKGETTAPSSDSGLGRKAFLYTLRSRKDEVTAKTATVKPKAKKALDTASKSTVSVKIAPAPSYEETKAALGLTAPVAEAAPEPVAPAPMPTAETAPGPTEPTASEVAPVASN